MRLKMNLIWIRILKKKTNEQNSKTQGCKLGTIVSMSWNSRLVQDKRRESGPDGIEFV